MRYYLILLLFVCITISAQTNKFYYRQYDSLTLIGNDAAAIKSPYYSLLQRQQSFTSFYNLACINARL
jgi:hypothetical protein